MGSRVSWKGSSASLNEGAHDCMLEFTCYIHVPRIIFAGHARIHITCTHDSFIFTSSYCRGRRRYWQGMCLDQHGHSRCLACLCKQVTAEGPGPSGTGAMNLLKRADPAVLVSCMPDLDQRSRRTGLSPCLPFVLAERRLLRRGCA